MALVSPIPRRWTPLALALLLASAPALAASHYHQTNLVSDGGVPAAHIDHHLVNGWGVAFNPYAFVWVNAADAGVSLLFDGSGNVQPLEVQIPAPNAPLGGSPTGIVFNGSDHFVVTRNGMSGPARFMFATEQGVIAAWAPNVDTTHAFRMVNRAAMHASYKGLAISGNGKTQLLYAADFHNGHVDVFDQNFKPYALPGTFTDPHLPAGFAPFGIQAIGGNIYVAYAKQDAAKADEVKGPGLGVVDVYSPNGHFIRRIAAGGALNAPWGMAMAPAGFGEFSNKLLIANFGNGWINAYSPTAGIPLGPLTDAYGKPIHIDGLWGIQFGNGVDNQNVNTLFFAAGPVDESHGLYGRLDFIH